MFPTPSSTLRRFRCISELIVDSVCSRAGCAYLASGAVMMRGITTARRSRPAYYGRANTLTRSTDIAGRADSDHQLPKEKAESSNRMGPRLAVELSQRLAIRRDVDRIRTGKTLLCKQVPSPFSHDATRPPTCGVTVPSAGFEPAIVGLEVRCLIHLATRASEPPVGFEPTTFALQERCATNCAKEAWGDTPGSNRQPHGSQPRALPH